MVVTAQNLGDNRLRADEQRTLRYDLPAAVTAIDAQMLYFLVPAKLATFIGLPAGAPEREPRIAASLSAERQAPGP